MSASDSLGIFALKLPEVAGFFQSHPQRVVAKQIGQTIEGLTVEVRGRLKRARATDRLTVNGQDLLLGGDGTFTTHLRLPQAGTYPLEFTVTDADGTRLAPRTVRVTVKTISSLLIGPVTGSMKRTRSSTRPTVGTSSPQSRASG